MSLARFIASQKAVYRVPVRGLLPGAGRVAVMVFQVA